MVESPKSTCLEGVEMQKSRSLMPPHQVSRFSLKNGCLRSLCRLYPFYKGRYRFMKLAERFLDKREQASVNLFGRYPFLLDLGRGDLESSFYYFIPEHYESETQQYIRGHVKPGMTVMDIGAHLGFFSILLADGVGPTGKVYAFEPEEKNFERLQLNLEANGFSWVSAYPMAFSDESGKQKLMLHYQYSSGHFLARSVSQARIDALGHGTQEVCVTTLDEVMENQNLRRIDLIKIDAEGSEALILRGGQKMLSSGAARHLICEVHSSTPDKADEVRLVLYGYGYRSYVLNSKLSGRDYLSELKPEEPVLGLQNLVFKKTT